MRTLNQSFNNARNEMILLNILRARYQHPLTFVNVTTVSGGQGAGASAGIPTITEGPGRTDAQKLFVFGPNSVSANGTSGVTIAGLETKEFYEGLLAPLNLKTVQFFIAQGYPRQVLYYLMISSIRIKGKVRDIIYWNDPADPTFPKFSEFIRQAALTGLTIEGESGRPHLCFDSGLSSTSLRGYSPICGRTRGPLVGLFSGQYGRAAIGIKFRSTYEIFRYLGKLVNPDLGERVQLISRHVGGTAINSETRLFPVEHGVTKTNCLTRVEYQGDVVCVPAESGEQGGLIMQLLAQLLALNVKVRDLPLIPTVRVAN